MNHAARLVTTTALVMGDLAVLGTMPPDVGALAGRIAAPQSWVTEAGADGAALSLAGAALWVLALWLGAGLVAAVVAVVPGSCGRLARTVARVLLPAALYRVVIGAAGLGLFLAPVAAGASASAGGGGHAAASTSTPPIPTPTWPSDPPSLPAPGWPSGPAAATPNGNVPPPGARPPQSAQPADARAVLVRPGDSLWDLAAARLGADGTLAQTAAAWPRWYAANRAVIGADPDLIKPGQRLTPPASTGGPR